VSVVGRVQINRPGAGGAVLPPTIPDDPPPTPGDYLALIVSDGAAAAWPLTENDATTVYADVIGSLDGVLDQATTAAWASGPIGPSTDHSPQFNGAGTFSTDPTDLSIVVPHSPLFEVGTGDFAMEMWLKPDIIAPTVTVFCLMGLLITDLSTYVVAQLGGPGVGADADKYRMLDSAFVDAASPAVYNDGLLHHLVFTRRAGAYFVLVDGVEVATATPATPISFAGAEVLTLGGIQYTAGGGNLYTLHGQIAWCAWYPVALSEAQAAAHFAAG